MLYKICKVVYRSQVVPTSAIDAIAIHDSYKYV